MFIQAGSLYRIYIHAILLKFNFSGKNSAASLNRVRYVCALNHKVHSSNGLQNEIDFPLLCELYFMPGTFEVPYLCALQAADFVHFLIRVISTRTAPFHFCPRDGSNLFIIEHFSVALYGSETRFTCTRGCASLACS